MVIEYPYLHCIYWKIQSVKILCLRLYTGSKRVRQEFTAFKLLLIQFQSLNIQDITLSLEKNLYFLQYFIMSKFSSKRFLPQTGNINAGSPEFFSDQNFLGTNSMKVERSGQISEKIKLMIESASKMISRLLVNLKYLYETNGIRYEINNYHNVIMRILTPHQLLSHFHIVDNYEIFWTNNIDKEHLIKCKFEKKYSKCKTNLKDQGRQKNGKMYPKNEQWYEQKSKEQKRPEVYQNFSKFELNLEKNSFNKQNSSQSDLSFNEVQKTSFGNRPILGADIQRRLVLWIIEQLVSKRGVKLREIAKQAKQFAYNVKGFKSSRGWVSRFFYRHPYLKEMIKQSKAGNYQMIKLMYLKIREKIFNTPIGQQDEQENAKFEDQVSKDEYSPESQVIKQFGDEQSAIQKQEKKVQEISQEYNNVFEEGQNSVSNSQQVSQYPRLRVPKQGNFWESNSQSSEENKIKRKDRIKKM